MDAGGRRVVFDAAILDAAEYAAGAGQPVERNPHRGSARASERRLVRSERQDAVLHAAAVPGELHKAVSRRHGAERLALHRWRTGSDATDGRLQGHEQESDAVARPTLF